MIEVSRRGFLKNLGLSSAVPFSGTGYATAYECGTALVSTPYALTPRLWRSGPRLRVAAIADVHAARPWMDERRISQIVAAAHAARPDVIVLLGDYVCTHPFVSAYVPPLAWAEVLSELRAPLGVYAILGNHDWWSAAMPTDPPDASRSVRAAIAAARIPLLENDAVRLVKDGRPFWLIGLGDQLAFNRPHGRHFGADDLEGSLSQLTDDAPAILLAHEPYIFRAVSPRVALTLSGHTHGGQINLPLVNRVLAPATGHGPRYVYGLYSEGERRMIVSGGLGTSYAPVRVLRPPEVVVVDVEPPDAAGA